MKLKQTRNFEALIGDTFGFIRETGAHFFPTMFRVNFLYLLAVALIVYFTFTMGYNTLDSLPGTGVHSYINWSGIPPIEHIKWDIGMMSWWMTLLGVVCTLLLLVGFAVFAAYTPAYMILYQREGRVPGFKEIVAFIRRKAGRLVIYFLGMFLLCIPVVIVCIPLFILLVFTIIGIALIPVVLLLILMMSSLMLYAYLGDERVGFFDSIDVAWRALKNAFWRNIFCNGIIYLITAILAVIPKIVTSAFDGAMGPGVEFLGVIWALLALAIHFFLTSFYSVNVGLIYFSAKADKYEYLQQ